MNMIRATEQELDELLVFYQTAADQMEAHGIRHWHWGLIPARISSGKM